MGTVEVLPVELGFARPFTREVAETLRLRNPGSEPIAFKVKTTAPKQYCVRPNSGRIESGQEVEVSVLLQPMKEEPPLEARCRDKFLVQSVAIAADKELNNVAQIWANIEQTAKGSIHEKKIRVNFLPAHNSSHNSTPSASGAAAAISTPAKSIRDEAPPSYSSPMASTPKQNSSEIAGGSSSTTETVSTKLEEVRASTVAAANSAMETVTSAVPSSDAMKAPGGVPVPLTAALCLLSFLLAYLLF